MCNEMNQENRKKLHNALIANNLNLFRKLMEKEIKKDNTEFHLIKFMSAEYKDNDDNDYLSTLENDELWVSSPLNFNDPFDCVLNIDYRDQICELVKPLTSQIGISNDQLKQHVASKEVYDELEEKLSKSDREVTKCIFVSCFSEKCNINSLVMWAHYAKNHTGICVEYDYREANKKRLKNATILPINYTDTRKMKTILKDDLHECREFHLNIAFTKSKEWKYEKEWRLLEIEDRSKKGSNGFKIPFIKPKSIYLGCKISDKLKKDIIKLCNQKNIEVYQMNMVKGSFKLNSEKIEK